MLESVKNNFIVVFLDGVGIGNEDILHNTFFKYRFDIFNKYFGAVPSLNNMHIKSEVGEIFPVDACMDVEGIPQSGTGQTALFTGINASKFLGKHFGPFPHFELMEMLSNKSIFNELLFAGYNVNYINAFPKRYFEYIKRGKRTGAISISYRSAGLKVNNSVGIRKGVGISADITNKRWPGMNYKLPIITPETAAKRLLKVASENKLTVYEYFYTDYIGHNRITGVESECLLHDLDRFLCALIEGLEKDVTTLIVCSDHGNIEDLSRKSHTFNPAMFMTFGFKSQQISTKVKSLYDLKNAIYHAMDNFEIGTNKAHNVAESLKM